MRVTVVSLLSMALAVPLPPSSDEATVLRAARILDGRGGVLVDKDIVVRGGLIDAIGPRGTGLPS